MSATAIRLPSRARQRQPRLKAASPYGSDTPYRSAGPAERIYALICALPARMAAVYDQAMPDQPSQQI